MCFFLLLLLICSLPSSLSQSSWVIQVELDIGPEEGISYLTDKGSTVSCRHRVTVSSQQIFLASILKIWLSIYHAVDLVYIIYSLYSSCVFSRPI